MNDEFEEMGARASASGPIGAGAHAEQPNVEWVADYERRRYRVAQKFEQLGVGSQANASYELRMHMNTVNGVLRGRLIRPERLDDLEKWVDRELAKRAAQGETTERPESAVQ